MDRQARAVLVMLAVGFALLLGGCKADENELYIQGSWFYNDLHIQQVVGESFQEAQWTFDRGTFSFYTCCFMRSELSGRYEILKSDADSITLELFQLNGRLNSERTDIKIKIDRDQQALNIQGTGPFTRVGP
jgi:hypothetical protein